MTEAASNQAETRPAIEECDAGAELKDWYWLKEELIAFCKERGLPYSGSKQAITDRIAHYLNTGEVSRPAAPKRTSSDFDWGKEPLTLETPITASYRNSQNVRAFMKRHYGENFSFNIAFMDWMKANVGKTLADAVEARREIAEREKTEKPAIPASNQYNRYTRDFFDANPDRTIDEARTCWAWKRARRGHNRYEPGDLVALED